MSEPWKAWPARWDAALRACDALGGEARELVIEPPASLGEVEAVEAELGLRLLESFRTVLTRFSSHAEFRWFLPENPRPPAPLKEIFSGEC